MVYIFGYITGKHYTATRFFLGLRWLFYFLLAHPILVALSALITLDFRLILVAIALDITTSYFYAPYKAWQKTLYFKRKWPVAWSLLQAPRTDYDDGYQLRQVWACPRLSLTFKHDHSDIVFGVKNAAGSTLEKLKAQTIDLAAQFKDIDAIEIHFDKPTSSRGQLKVLFAEHDSIPETPEIPQANY